jgi:hypothetical protein
VTGQRLFEATDDLVAIGGRAEIAACAGRHDAPADGLARKGRHEMIGKARPDASSLARNSSPVISGI